MGSAGDTTLAQLLGTDDQVLERAPQAVQPAHDQGIAGAQYFKGSLQLRPVRLFGYEFPLARELISGCLTRFPSTPAPQTQRILRGIAAFPLITDTASKAKTGTIMRRLAICHPTQKTSGPAENVPIATDPKTRASLMA